MFEDEKISRCSECTSLLETGERCVYKRKVYCQPCLHRVKRRGA